MSSEIYSVAFSRDNQSVYISDDDGYIKIIKWEAGANSGDEFDFSEEPKKIGRKYIKSICLTKDEKHLLVGSRYLLSVFETKTREVIKEFKMTNYVKKISLIKDDKKAIIAESNGNLSILDLETLEIFSVAKNITNNQYLSRILVI